MSFLIKDILQLHSDESSESSNSKCKLNKTEKSEFETTVNCNKYSATGHSKPYSILEHTLSNTSDLFSSTLSERCNYYSCYGANSTSIMENYRARDSVYSVYERDQCWPYHAFPMTFSCTHIQARRKGAQIRFTANQTRELEKHFSFHKYLSPKDRKQLADLLRLSDRQVKTWFQNRRAKWRRNNENKNVRVNYTSSSILEQMHHKLQCEKIH